MKTLGFIVPVYNGEDTLEELHLRIKMIAQQLNESYQIVFVNDASPDDSWTILQNIKERDNSNVTIIRLMRNAGQHNAIMCGLRYCPTTYLITLDDDLQTPPEEIEKLLSHLKLNHLDVVYGVYGNKQHSKIRNLGSSVIQRIFAIVFKAKGSISSFRVFTNGLKNRILYYKTQFAFVDGFIHWETIRIGRVEVMHNKRKSGKSGYTWSKLINLSTNLIFNFTTIPLSVIISLGVIFSIISFALSLIFIIRKLIYDVPLGYTSIVVIILFSTGLLLIVIGILGEYIKRLYLSVLNSPSYTVDEIIE